MLQDSYLCKRSKQFEWVCNWLSEQNYLKTLDSLLEEGADLLSEFDTEEDDALPRIGDGVYANSLLKSFDTLHDKNILSARFHHGEDINYIMTTSSDKTLKVFDWETGDVKINFHHSIIISTDWHPHISNRVAVGTMDSHVLVLEFDFENNKTNVLYDIKSHGRHVIRVRWHPTGNLLASASNDHKVITYKQNEEKSYEQVQEFTFDSAIEAMTFTNSGEQLIVASRDSSYLHYINIDSSEIVAHNLCNNAFSDNPGFSVLDLNVSHDDKYVLAATDKDSVITFVTGTPIQARSFYGMKNDKWSQPKVDWSSTLNYIYTTSQDNKVYVYDMSNEKNVFQLEGHTGIVRDIHRHPTKEILLTCSYDKTIKLWHRIE